MNEPVISIQNLSRRFDQKTALDNLTLEVPRGSVFGLVGENGAGKTTLIRHLLGLLRAEQGSVRVFGLDPVADPPGVLSRIGYLSEDRDLPGWMRVGELIRYRRAFYPGWDDAYAESLREAFELDPAQKVNDLSRGRRALAGLLVALAYRPPLLILDEPSSGLDPIVRRDILLAIIQTVTDEGRTVLFSSHLLEEVDRVCDRLAMINEGRLVMSGELDAIKQAHRRLTLRFAAPLSVCPALPGVLFAEGAGAEWSFTVNGQLEQFRDEAARQGAELLEDRSASIDEIFIARAR